jgi:hypothetical protein
MDDNYIVEVWGQPAGIVLKQDGLYRFHAVARAFFALEGTAYDKPGKARLAAARLSRKSGAKAQSATDTTASPASMAERAPRRRAKRSASISASSSSDPA